MAKPDLVGSVEWVGGKITKRGVYSNMGIRAYHHPGVCDGVSISSSGLRKILIQSPAHFWVTSPLNPERLKDDKPTRPMVLGRAMHHLALGQAMFGDHFIVAPTWTKDAKGVRVPWSLKYKAAQEWFAENQNEFTDVIFPDEINKLNGMARALNAHPFVQNGALNGYVERSGFIRDEETNVWVKIRPDAVPTQSGDFVDLKVTHSVQHHMLVRTIAEHGYAQQFALMRKVFRELRIPFHSSTLIFVEAE